MRAMKLLVLGGTLEARELTERLARDGYDVVTSLAGRTREPRPMAGRLRVGGFGGVEGLSDYLRIEKFDALIDATHPFAERISENARLATSVTGVALRVLRRPPWRPVDGDRWVAASDLQGAANALPMGATALLALGRQHLAPFAGCDGVRFVVRSIEPFEPPFECELVLQRPSPDPATEAEFLRSRTITHVVSRNSGGPGAYAKIAAARMRSLDVVMIDRAPEIGPAYADVDALLGSLRPLASVP